MGASETNVRKVPRGETEIGCPVQRGEDGVWQVRGYAAGRALLRSTGTVQAGLGVETLDKMPAKIRRPVLYRDGVEHREHRRQTAKFFTPRRVDEHYRELMHRIADSQIDKLRQDGQAHLADLSFHLAIEVTSAVIGLTNSKPGIQGRLERFFPEKFGKPGFTSLHGLYWIYRQATNWLGMYFADVRPAARVRRKQRQDDLISHLIDEGCTDAEILGECITFAAAGMVTTREFVNVAAWHLFADEALRDRYRQAEETERVAILHEILRIEPVISRLKRRTTEPVEVPGEDGTVTIPPGDLVEVVSDVANLDEQVMGERPLAVCPERAITEGTSSTGLSFGDGPHKCPGAHIAIMETDVFLTKLFAMDGLHMEAEPRISYNDEISGYELRGLIVTVPKG
jgi:cytochrome P450